jgi:hypothetical protein
MRPRLKCVLACACALALVLSMVPAAWAAVPRASRPPRAAKVIPAVRAMDFAADTYEDDDLPEDARAITADSSLQARTLTTASTLEPWGDYDYAYFAGVGGRTYQIKAWDPGGATQTFLEVGDADFMTDYVSNSTKWIVSAGTGSDIYWTCPTTGNWYICVSDDSYDGVGGNYFLQVNDVGTPAAGTGLKIQGANRYEVARNVAYKVNYDSWAGINTVIIASGLDRAAADPLTAGGLAGVVQAPILLINQDDRNHVLPSYTKSAIQSIHAVNPGVDFYLVGGTASCPTWVQSQIQKVTSTGGHTFTRLAGADRYACSARIAQEVRARRSTPPVGAWVANGETSAFFFDALAASPLAYAFKFPLLLVKKGSVPTATRNELSAGGYAIAHVVGNTYEVTEPTRESMALTVPTDRIGETLSYYDRCRLARYVAEDSYAHAWMAQDQFVVANRLPDALTGGTLAGSRGAVLLLTEDAEWLGDDSATVVQQRRPTITTWYTIGGPASISPWVGEELSYLTGNTTPPGP